MDKNILFSKTFWLGLVTAFAPLFPAVQSFIAENSVAVGAVLGLLMIVLRKYTSKPVSVLPK